ncbi:MAG TPA: hypothetical protein VH186_28980 [Chloroflexia bacterium]|nr:hypothetical protein [Chloroflexia bacterium]
MLQVENIQGNRQIEGSNYNYTACGLTINSNFALPGFRRTEANSFLPALQLSLNCWPKEFNLCLPDTALEPEWYRSPYTDLNGEPFLRGWQLDQGRFFWLRYSDGTSFLIERSGSKIWANWPEELTLENTLAYFSGLILGFVLRLQGKVALHASAVGIDGRCVLFVGNSGGGKSTLAAAFAKEGYEVLSDDLVALGQEGDKFVAYPSFSRIRLWPDSTKALSLPPTLPRIFPSDDSYDKRYLDITKEGYSFQEKPLQPAAIFVLGERSQDSSAPYIEKLPVSEGLISLITHTFGNWLLDKEMRGQEFKVLGRLLQEIRVARLVSHVDLNKLSTLCKIVLENYRESR